MIVVLISMNVMGITFVVMGAGVRTDMEITFAYAMKLLSGSEETDVYVSIENYNVRSLCKYYWIE